MSVERPAAALFGAALMIVFGLLPADQVFAAIDLDIIGLLLGMMIIVSCLEIVGLFARVSDLLLRACGDLFTFLCASMGVTALLSALILNDTVVLMFTPIIKVCRSLEANPVPFLVGEALAANIGSVATGVGNPQNAYILIHSGMSFPSFAMTMTPLAVVSLVVAVFMVALVFKRDLFDGTLARPRTVDHCRTIHEPGRERGKAPLYMVLGVLAAVFLGFVLSPLLNTPISLIAFLGGLFPSTCPAFAQEGHWHHPHPSRGGLDAPSLLCGPLHSAERGGDLRADVPFAAVLRAHRSGDGRCGRPLHRLRSALQPHQQRPSGHAAGPPAVPLGSDTLWLALATSSTLAGNATVLGAAANIIVVEKGLTMGVEVRLWDFMKAGLPVTLVTLLISVLYLGA